VISIHLLRYIPFTPVPCATEIRGKKAVRPSLSVETKHPRHPADLVSSNFPRRTSPPRAGSDCTSYNRILHSTVRSLLIDQHSRVAFLPPLSPFPFSHHYAAPYPPRSHLAACATREDAFLGPSSRTNHTPCDGSRIFLPQHLSFFARLSSTLPPPWI